MGIVSVCVTGWITYTNAKDTLEAITFERLTSVRENKKRQIESYFDEINKQIKTLSEDKFITETFKSLSTLSLNYKTPNKQLEDFILRFSERYNIDEILFFNTTTKNIVYSLRTKDKKSSIDSSFINNYSTFVLRIINNNLKSVVFSDLIPSSDNKHVISFLASTPVIVDGQKTGAIILRILNSKINEIMTSNNNWKDAGFGETGEAYIVGADYKLRNNSRFFIQKQTEYYKLLKKSKIDEFTINLIKKNNSSILLQTAKTKAVKEALSGVTDTKLILDYRNIEVLSSYTPINIYGLKWVILAEIDTREAFSSIYILREKLIMISLLIIIMAALIGVIITQTILRPLNNVITMAQKFSNGDLTYRNPIIIKNEFGILVDTLNNMAENLLNKTTLLNEKITDKNRIEEELKLSEEKLRSLSMHLQTIREEERKGIAREIHDELGQSLNAIKLKLSLFKQEFLFENTDTIKNLDDVFVLIDETIQSVKRLITQLRPQLLDDLGLIAAIEWYTREFEKSAKIACNLTIFQNDFDIEPEKAISIFRVFQETLTNAARHSHASQLEINLTKNNRFIQMIVEDNGIGITEEQINNSKSFGLLGMKERVNYWGGKIIIEGFSNKGTKLLVQIPN